MNAKEYRENEQKHHMVEKGNSSWSSCYIGDFTHLNYNAKIHFFCYMEVRIDLSRQPAGVYLFKITIGDNTSTWKITRK